ncbi:LysR family transcriptional regulator [Fructobacillus durionis]|uniref:Regulatory helix-turn-helix protein, lysR family n=1 Tax=Fructobacillus durionis TaxID=283737 RepID=A0A1I1GQ26_9LACO|nr:LysR family transcriptional regulator [Fructobacillus durionis]SFC13857.1 regulatory helix-turn-helix protein, lysR family [Fructobacillus durionis]
MRIQDLEYYLSLAELGSFSQVSKKFQVSQPTISLAMQRLEKELNTELIWRDPGHQKLALTHPGQILLKHAKKIVAQYQQAEDEIQKEAEQKLVLGLSEIVDFAYFPSIEEHLSDHFFTHLRKETVNAETALEQLQKGQFDALLITGSLPIEEKLTIIDIPHPPLHLSAGKPLPDFQLSFVYQKDSLENSDLALILEELQGAIASAQAKDFALISKSE